MELSVDVDGTRENQRKIRERTEEPECDNDLHVGVSEDGIDTRGVECPGGGCRSRQREQPRRRSGIDHCGVDDTRRSKRMLEHRVGFRTGIVRSSRKADGGLPVVVGRSIKG